MQVWLTLLGFIFELIVTCGNDPWPLKLKPNCDEEAFQHTQGKGGS